MILLLFVFRAILCMRNYSVLRLILAFLPIIQHFQDAAYYSKNYSSIISSGLATRVTNPSTGLYTPELKRRKRSIRRELSTPTIKLDTGRYMCDKQCVGWKSRNICAHCLAVVKTAKEFHNVVSLFDFP